MIISKTPLRISFAGGGTDFPEYYQAYGGAVISSAIDKYVYVIVKPRFDKLIALSWSRKELVSRVDDIQHELIREAMIMTGVTSGVEITTIADIPSSGSGLGSSSAVTVGLLNALYYYQGKKVPAKVLAEQACHIELTRLCKPIGKQDQYIAALGGLQEMVFLKDDRVVTKVCPVTTDLNRQITTSLLLFNTGLGRKAETILSHQKNGIKTNCGTLREIHAQVGQMKQALLAGDIQKVGKVLDYTWSLKKNLADGISTSQIDKMYSLAKQAGAYGGKITGAGGGGHLLVVCSPKKRRGIIKALADYAYLPVSLEPWGSKVTAIKV